MRKLAKTAYLTRTQHELLKKLSEQTKVPLAVYIRQGIDLILEKNKDAFSDDSTRLHTVISEDGYVGQSVASNNTVE